MADEPTEYDLSPYLWLVVVGAFGSFFAAFGIGANDVANAYATSVGSRALTIKQACVLAFIFEFLGAFLGGSSVSDTIRKKIADVECFADDPAQLMCTPRQRGSGPGWRGPRDARRRRRAA